MSHPRKTAISWVDAGNVSVRGYGVGELIGNISFASGIFLLLNGELPDEKQEKLFEAILISVIDHGVSPPSTIAAVTVANTGASLNAAVAAGLLAINKYHGGAIEDAMDAIIKASRISKLESLDADEAASRLVAEYKSADARISGFGHRLHAADPRTARLFELAAELGFSGNSIRQAVAIEKALGTASGRLLPINADGAIAALLCELNFPPDAANGIFMIARVPGLVAHALEERHRTAPMRTVDVENYQYDGPKARTV